MARLYAFFQPLQHLLWSDFYLNRTRQLQFMDNMKFKSITKDTISLFAIWPHGFLEVHWQQMCSTRLLNRLHLTLWRNFTPIPLKHISSVASNWSAKLFNCLDNTGMLVTPEATFDLMRLHAYQMTFTHTHTCGTSSWESCFTCFLWACPFSSQPASSSTEWHHM